ncbi:hypothetical protein E9228_001698 [Curtobacterium flaccumfaciens]|uniref:Uncharacterized protein n=1 Tax=Curtobacterium salicis TaxID=1779862 RepID=A0ABX0T6F9_9MICO|nr:hypothetical protein [Curtobacterium sp. WW7]NII41062.1 hypothetical protein [Curtobacterium sp. WW7]
MQKRTTLAAAAGLALALGAPLIASVPATAATLTAQTSASASQTQTQTLYTPFVRSVDGVWGEITNDEDGAEADLFTFEGHTASRTAEVLIPGAGGLVHAEQRVDGGWREVATFDLAGQGDHGQLQLTVPQDEGYVEYRLFATDHQGNRSGSRTFYVVEY